MRVLYITSLSPDSVSGAQEHIMKIFTGLEKEGFDVRLVRPSKFEGGIAGAVRRKIALAGMTKKAIKSFSPHIVYFRYDGAEILSIKEVLHHKIPLVLELNTKTLAELRSTHRFLPYYISLITEPWIFSRAAGIAAVSPEIYQYAIRLGRKEKPFLLAKNGVDADSITYLGYDPLMRKHYDTPFNAPLLAMIGSIAPWHGVDRLLQAMSTNPMKDFYLWIIGNVSMDKLKERFQDQRVFNRIRTIPWQPTDALSAILSAADIGIGALALHLRGLTQVQLLKTRTYLASGLPVLLGHTDPVISDSHSFITEGIHDTVGELTTGIVEFYRSIREKRQEVGRQAREFAENNLSWECAAKETAAFLTEICGKNN